MSPTTWEIAFSSKMNSSQADLKSCPSSSPLLHNHTRSHRQRASAILECHWKHRASSWHIFTHRSRSLEFCILFLFVFCTVFQLFWGCNIWKIFITRLAIAAHCWMMLHCVVSKVEPRSTFWQTTFSSFPESNSAAALKWMWVFEKKVLLTVWTWLKGVNGRTGWWRGENGFKKTARVEGTLGLWGYWK